MNNKRHAEIAGAGFAGLTAAAALARRGWRVRVHEQADRLRTAGAGIYIYENGLRIFETLGIYEAIVKGAHPAYKREMRDDANRIISTIDWDTTRGRRLFTIVRQRCIDALADAARAAGAEIVTGSKAVAARPEGVLELADGREIEADLVVAADGVNSLLRDSLGLLRSRKFLVDGAIRLLLARTAAERSSEEGRKYIEYWSGTRRILYTPCSDDEIYLAFTMLNRDEEATAVPVRKETWKGSFPHLAELIDRIGDQGRYDPFEIIRLSRWSKGRVAVIGDAAHALPPNLGQGGGCAMMNALSLATILDEHATIDDALEDWERRERPLTEHTQRISMLYSIPTTWPPRLRAYAFAIAGKSKWLTRQRMKTANHVPTGTRESAPADVRVEEG